MGRLIDADELKAVYTPSEIEGFEKMMVPVEVVLQNIDDIPSAQPTFYGYTIETLAAVAEIMKKERVTPEEAIQLFKNATYMANLIRAEFYENVNNQLVKCLKDEDG